MNVPEEFSRKDLSKTHIITFTGSRITDKGKFDKQVYEQHCVKTLNMKMQFDTFFYCPKQTGVFGNTKYRVYDGSNPTHFNFSGNLERVWDECKSDVGVSLCANRATDCVDAMGRGFPNGSVIDADLDGEMEVCVAITENLQGGWADPDMSEELCNLAREKSHKFVFWNPCNNQSSCENANGHCYGDDPYENYISTPLLTKSRKLTSDHYVATCENASCAYNGECYDDESKICHETGKMMQCEVDENAWILLDETCDTCGGCDFNKDGRVEFEDIILLTGFIDAGLEYDAAFDLNQDLVLTKEDMEYCVDNYYHAKCSICGNNHLSSVDQCEMIQDEVVFNSDYSCPAILSLDSIKFANISLTRQNECDDCVCSYELACFRGRNGAICGTDPDTCPAGQRCNIETCSCVIEGCPIGTHLCADGVCKSSCNGRDSHCIARNYECEESEECDCPDCVGHKTSCGAGMVCGPFKQCVCEKDHFPCSDGTCSPDC